MNIRYKEDPRAWRNSVLFSLAPLIVLAALLHWRHFISREAWLGATLTLFLIGILACAKSAWFRGFYRASTWAGFWSSQAVARVLLGLLFVVIMVPVGFLLRLAGKDPLKLRRSQNATTYWRPARSDSSLDRLF
jgi:hypothetical protein